MDTLTGGTSTTSGATGGVSTTISTGAGGGITGALTLRAKVTELPRIDSS